MFSVTGSNGFIGGDVCAELKQKGCHVIGLGRRTKSLAECDEYVCCDLFTDHVGHIIRRITDCDELPLEDSQRACFTPKSNSALVENLFSGAQ